jgi:hypothetical protein
MLNPDLLIEKSRRKYLGCRNYFDKGTASFWDRTKIWRTINFTTNFERSEYFSFEFDSFDEIEGHSSVSSIVWSTREKTLFKWVTREQYLITDLDFNRAIGLATMPSDAAISNIPTIFYKPAKASFNFLNLTDIEAVSEETFAGEPCTVLKGRRPFPGDVVLWIRSDGAIIRIVDFEPAFGWSEQQSREFLLKAIETIPQEYENSFADVRLREYRYNVIEFDGPIQRVNEPSL